MTKTIKNKNLSEAIRIAVANDPRTREEIVVLVQYRIKPHGISFSLPGLNKLCKGEAPKKDTEIVLQAVLEVLGLDNQLAS